MIYKVFLLTVFSTIVVYSTPVDHHVPQPYKFGYTIKDKHGEQYREEEGDGKNAVKGSYGFVDTRGIKRQVDYVADHDGFRAKVQTNEPGTANQNPAAVLMISSAPYGGGAALNGEASYGLGNGVPVSNGNGVLLNGGLVGGNRIISNVDGALISGNRDLANGNRGLSSGNRGLSSVSGGAYEGGAYIREDGRLGFRNRRGNGRGLLRDDVD